MQYTKINTDTVPYLSDYKCNINVFNMHVVHHTMATDPRSFPCSKLKSGTNEDLVLSACNVSSPDTWTKGLRVGIYIIIYDEHR